MCNIFNIDEIVIVLCTNLEIKESLLLSSCNRYLNVFVKNQHCVRKLIYKWDIPISLEEDYYNSFYNFYIIGGDTIRNINGTTWQISYQFEKLNFCNPSECDWIPTRTGMLVLTDTFHHIELEPTIKVDNWQISAIHCNFDYNGKTLLVLEPRIINWYLHKQVKSLAVSVYGWIFQYDDKYIIKDIDNFYVLNYNIDGLIERTIKNNLDGRNFIMINKDMVCVYNNYFYHTDLQPDKLVWTKFYNIPVDYNVLHLEATQNYLICILQHNKDIYNNYRWYYNDTKNFKSSAKLIIYDYKNKKLVYEEDIKYAPESMSIVGTTILLQWENNKMLAYNIKYILQQ
jgi:hypothetical protein